MLCKVYPVFVQALYNPTLTTPQFNPYKLLHSIWRLNSVTIRNFWLVLTNLTPGVMTIDTTCSVPCYWNTLPFFHWALQMYMYVRTSVNSLLLDFCCHFLRARFQNSRGILRKRTVTRILVMSKQAWSFQMSLQSQHPWWLPTLRLCQRHSPTYSGRVSCWKFRSSWPQRWPGSNPEQR